MVITKIKKNVEVLNEMDASFCNCSKPNMVPQVKAEELNKNIKKAYTK